MNPENVIYRFGTLLVNLLSGKQIPPSHVSDYSQVLYLLVRVLDQPFMIHLDFVIVIIRFM